jgi:4'-phosphopantetheinyl transferase
VCVLDLSGPARADDDAAVLDPAESARAARFVRDEDRARFLRRRVAARHLLARELGCPPAELRFGHGPHGKPCVRAPRTDLQLSASASGPLALLALARRPVGVDVEHVRPGLASLGAAAFFLTPAELARWAALPAEPQVEAFFAAWTHKEAVAKARGLGLPASRPTEHAVGEVDGVVAFEPAPGYVAALAVLGHPRSAGCGGA